MDRASLETLLANGLSLADIGRRFERHESTVAYWVQRHGLEAVHRERHAARGRPDEQRLKAMVDSGLSVAQIAAELKRSKGTVRHWLRRLEMKTQAKPGCPDPVRQAAKAAGRVTVLRECHRHGLTEFWLEGRGYYRCKRCRAERVSRRRRKVKEILAREAGGRCALCGYDRCRAALHFHHLDPSTKRFNLSMEGVTRSLQAARAEMAKCVLLCANCHAEVEAGVRAIPPATAGRQLA